MARGPASTWPTRIVVLLICRSWLEHERRNTKIVNTVIVMTMSITSGRPPSQLSPFLNSSLASTSPTLMYKKSATIAAQVDVAIEHNT
jgi:hypothetical protein